MDSLYGLALSGAARRLPNRAAPTTLGGDPSARIAPLAAPRAFPVKGAAVPVDAPKASGAQRRVPIAKIELTEEEIQAAVEVLRSGALRQGRVCEAFEEAFAEKTGAKRAVACASGSAALHLAYQCVLQCGDEVLVPSFTFIATASMAGFAGAKPVFCDIDPDTFLIDLNDAERRVTPKTKAIAPVHLFGNPCETAAVRKFAERHGLSIVWDAAQAHGARVNGADIGSEEGLVCYSFYPSKNMFVGEGGMVTTHNAEWADSMRTLRQHGESGKYYHTHLAMNHRMTDVEAAIGLRQLERLDEMLRVRRRNGAILLDRLRDVPGVRTQTATAGAEHAWHQFCIVIDEAEYGIGRDGLQSRLEARGIGCSVHYPRGLHQQPVYVRMYGEQSLPVTERVAASILAVPVHHGLTEEDAHAVADAIRDCAAR